MIFILHGDNQPAVREALTGLRSRYRQCVFWEKEASEVVQFVQSPTLFGLVSAGAEEVRELVVVEDPGAQELRVLAGLGDEFKDIAMVFSGELPKAKIPEGKNLKVLFFQDNVPKNVFPFVDAVIAGERERSHALAARLVKDGEDVPGIFGMLNWQFKSLSKVKSGECGGMHPFTVKKLGRHKKDFTDEQISEAMSCVREADFSVKSGKPGLVELDFLIDRLLGDSY
jgi:hypothetical protein